MFDDGQPVAELPPDFFSTDFYTGRIIECLQSGDAGQPFFAYLSFSAVHLTLRCGGGYRLPEPVRLADRRVAQFKRGRRLF